MIPIRRNVHFLYWLVLLTMLASVVMLPPKAEAQTPVSTVTDLDASVRSNLIDKKGSAYKAETDGVILGSDPEKYPVIEEELPLRNAGFEEPAVNGEIPGWFVESSSEYSYFELSDERSASGDYSLKLTDTVTDRAIVVVSEPVAAEPGVEYTGKANLYIEEGRTLINMRFYDENGKMIVQHEETVTSGQGRWQEVQVKATAPAKTAYVAVAPKVSNYYMTISYYDDIRISYVNETGMVEVERELSIPNRSFEQELVNGEIPGWSDVTASKGPGTSYELSNEMSYSGDYSLKITDTVTDGAVVIMSELAAIEPGVEYTGKAKLYIEEGRTLIHMRFFDANGHLLEQHEETVTSGQGHWQEVQVKATAPANAAYAAVAAKVSNYYMTVSYYDDFSITYIEKVPAWLEVGLTANRTEVQIGESVALELTSNFDLSEADVSYSSDNEQVAVVDANGLITALDEGTAEISVEVSLNNERDTASLNIIVDSTPPQAPEIISPERPLSTNNATPQVAVKAEANSLIQIWENETQVGSGVGEGDSEVKIRLARLTQGIHKLTATATDTAGNQSENAKIPHIIINQGRGHGVEDQVDFSETLKVLAIGNSFSWDSMLYLGLAE